MRKSKVAREPLRMQRLKQKRAAARHFSAKMDLAFASMQDTQEHEPLPQIDRRQLTRTRYETTAWLGPTDDTGAIRRPVIHTRDFNTHCLGFRTRQDVSALSEAILRLPAATGQFISVACRIRRSLELDNGWFDGLVEFLQPQPHLISRQRTTTPAKPPKTSHNASGHR